MSIEEFIIFAYLIIDELYPIVINKPLSTRGFLPALTDVEIITMQIVGEVLGMDIDKSIWRYLKNCLSWFLKLRSYPNFCNHCANLWQIHQKITARLTACYGAG